jgi:hypothetical protein
MNKGWFAIIDLNKEEAFVMEILYSGTNRQAVDRLYPSNDFSGPWDTEAEAEKDLTRLIDNCPLSLERI